MCLESFLDLICCITFLYHSPLRIECLSFAGNKVPRTRRDILYPAENSEVGVVESEDETIKLVVVAYLLKMPVEAVQILISNAIEVE